MSDFSLYLEGNEKKAIIAVVATISQTINSNLVDIYLFGSKARGDFHADSDIDLLIIVNHLDSDSRWEIRAIAADCSLQYDVLFNTHIVEKARWDMMVQYQDTLWREVQRDSISLYQLVTQPTTSH